MLALVVTVVGALVTSVFYLTFVVVAVGKYEVVLLKNPGQVDAGPGSSTPQICTR